MKTRIGKDFYWEMSHRLKDHNGLCRNIHGHSYKMRLEVEGNPDETGMVMDYYDMAQLVGPLIRELDHCFLCETEDTLMINFLKENNLKYRIMPKPSTAENICEYILSEIEEGFRQKKNITGIGIKVFETEDVFAEIRIDLSNGE